MLMISSLFQIQNRQNLSHFFFISASNLIGKKFDPNSMLKQLVFFFGSSVQRNAQKRERRKRPLHLCIPRTKEGMHTGTHHHKENNRNLANQI
jgi:hypothetical protein